jgi:hypothetical protein
MYLLLTDAMNLIIYNTRSSENQIPLRKTILKICCSIYCTLLPHIGMTAVQKGRLLQYEITRHSFRIVDLWLLAFLRTAKICTTNHHLERQNFVFHSHGIEIWSPLGFYSMSIGNYLQTFLRNVVPLFSVLHSQRRRPNISEYTSIISLKNLFFYVFWIRALFVDSCLCALWERI